MRRIYTLLFLIALTLVLSSTAMVERVKWYTLEEAQLLSQKSGRPILIDFTAKWCGWCKKMDKTTFSNSEVVTILNQKFYAVRLDFDSKNFISFNGKKTLPKEFAQSFGVQGLPTMVVISSDYEKSETIVGFQKPKLFLKLLEPYKSW